MQIPEFLCRQARPTEGTRVLKQQKDRQDQVLPSGFFRVSVGFVGLVVRCLVLVSYLFRGLTQILLERIPLRNAGFSI